MTDDFNITGKKCSCGKDADGQNIEGEWICIDCVFSDLKDVEPIDMNTVISESSVKKEEPKPKKKVEKKKIEKPKVENNDSDRTSPLDFL